jgi:hypothetical protein
MISRENSNSNIVKTHYLFEYEINSVVCESSFHIFQFLKYFSQFVESESRAISTLQELLQLNSKLHYYRSVWKNQIRLIPGCGPFLASHIFALFPTPHNLYDAVQKNENFEEFFCDLVNKRSGRQPKEITLQIILNLFRN